MEAKEHNFYFGKSNITQLNIHALAPSISLDFPKDV